MPMISVCTSGIAERIACASIIIQYFMNQAALEKRFESTINGDPIIFSIHGKFNIAMRDSDIFFKENRNNITSALGKPKGMILQ